MSGVDPASFVGSWSHSHEEDGEGVEVFRPVDYDFPPSRGRETMTLRPDGTILQEAGYDPATQLLLVTNG
jgi:hypothetical protein